MSEYRIISCTKCGQKLRIPANKSINVNCPTCSYSFRVNYDSMNASQSKKQTASGYVSSGGGRFADQLRQTDFQKEESRMQQTEITRRAEKYAAVIRSACTISARSGSRSVKGYVHNYVDDGYEEWRFASDLPSIEKYKQDAIKYNNQKYWKGSTYHSGGSTGRREFPLWDSNWYLTKDPAYAESFRSSLLTILKNDGFIGINLRILNEPVTYVIEDVKASLFSGRMTKTVSSRSTNERVYILEIMVQW